MILCNSALGIYWSAENPWDHVQTNAPLPAHHFRIFQKFIYFKGADSSINTCSGQFTWFHVENVNPGRIAVLYIFAIDTGTALSV